MKETTNSILLLFPPNRLSFLNDMKKHNTNDKSTPAKWNETFYSWQHKFENVEWALSPAKRFAYVNTDERQTVADLDPMKMRNLKCHGAFRISKRLRGDCKARLRKPIR